MEAMLGMIIAVPWNWAPYGWMPCDGRLLNINQYTALYTLLGTTYGGNGTTTFGLPDLRGRVPIGMNPNAGTPIQPNVPLGQVTGSTSATLTQQNLPAHVHQVQIGANQLIATSTMKVADVTTGGTTPAANSAISASPSTGQGQAAIYVTGTDPSVTLHASTVTTTIAPIQAPTSVAGAGMPFSVMQPSLGLNFIICSMGLFPTRN